ncbi:unnamed protein product, partial [Tenebrio molitor]
QQVSKKKYRTPLRRFLPSKIICNLRRQRQRQQQEYEDVTLTAKDIEYIRKNAVCSFNCSKKIKKG